jgi:hypothetical protein
MILTGMPLAVTTTISPATLAILTGVTWFPTTLAHAFMPSLATTFIIGAILSFIAAAMCARGGEKYVHGVPAPGSEGSPQETTSQQVSGERTK